jgi:hypothetical protein
MTAPCNLLQLPWELRYEIYNYLTHDVGYVWKTEERMREGLYPRATIKLYNTPLPAMLVTCSRLRDEYT